MKKIFLFLLVIMWAIPAYSVQQTITSGAGTEHQWSVQKGRINNNFDELYLQAATHWVPDGHTYTADIDTVTHGGKIYICTTTHNSSAAGVAGNEPGVGGNWLDVWKPIDASGLGLGTTDNVTFGNVNASGGTLSAGVANTTQGALLLYSNTDPIYSFGLTPAASPTAIVSLKAPPAMPGGSNYLLNFDADGTGGWTDPASIGGSSTLGALTDVTGEGTTDYMLYDDGDGTFSFRAAPSGSMTWPSTAGIVGWTSGTTWDHYTLDTDLSSVSASDDSIPSAKAVDAAYQKKTAMEFVDVDGTTIEKSGTGSEADPYVLGVKSGVYLGTSAKATDSDLLDNHDTSYFQTALTNPIVRADLDTTPTDDDTVPPSSGALYDHTTNAAIHVTKISGTSTLGTVEIASGACATTVTTTATGAATTDVISGNFNSSPLAVTGYAASASGGLFIYAWPTTDNVNFSVCNNTAAAITPGARTLNWQIIK